MVKLRAIVAKPSKDAFAIEEVDSCSENSSPVKATLAPNDRQGIPSFNSPRNTAIIPKNTRSPVTFFQKGDFIKKWLLTTDLAASSNSSLNSIVENSIDNNVNNSFNTLSENKRSPRSPLAELNKIKRPRLNIDHKVIHRIKTLRPADQESVLLFESQNTTINKKNDQKRKIEETNENNANDRENVDSGQKNSEIDLFECQTIENNDLQREMTNERILPRNLSPLQGNDEGNGFLEKISTISSPKSSTRTISTVLTPRSRLVAVRAAVFGKLKRGKLFKPGDANDFCDREDNGVNTLGIEAIEESADNPRLSSFCNLAISQGESMASRNIEIESSPSSVSSECLDKVDIASVESTQRPFVDIESDEDEVAMREVRIENAEDDEKILQDLVGGEDLKIESDEDGDDDGDNIAETIIEEENIDETFIEDENIENIENVPGSDNKVVDRRVFGNDNVVERHFCGNVRKRSEKLSECIEDPVDSQFPVIGSRGANAEIGGINDNSDDEEECEEICVPETQDSDLTYFSGGMLVDRTMIEEPGSQEISEATVSHQSSKSRSNLTISDRSASVPSMDSRRNEIDIYPAGDQKVVKKKKKAKKGSMLEKYQTLMNGRISFLRMWRHQMAQARFKGTCNQFIKIKITEYSTTYGRPYFQGKILTDTHNLLQKSLQRNPNDSASSNSADSLNRTITVLTIPEVVGQFNVKEKSALRLYPPWEVIDADKLILSVLYFNLISDESENSQEESRINDVLIQEFNCPCLNARKLVNSCHEKFEKVKPNAMDYFFK